jgi:IclR family mhp operon transcriptional activator
LHVVTQNSKPAFCDDRLRATILRRLSEQGGEEGRLAKDRVYIERMLSEVRERGYGVRDPSIKSLPSDTEEEFRAIALPILVKGEVQACLSFVWMTSAYLDPDIDQVFYEQLCPGAEELAQLFEHHQLY